MRIPGAWDGFELAMRAVLGQQITVVAAIRLGGKLVAAHGAPLARPEDGLTHVFPELAAIAAADLAPLGMPRSRARTLSAVASAALADPTLFEAGNDLDVSVRRLREIWGVGEWTAQYIALRLLREPDAFPAADIGLIRALEALESRSYTAAELLERSAAWRPWRPMRPSSFGRRARRAEAAAPQCPERRRAAWTRPEARVSVAEILELQRQVDVGLLQQRDRGLQVIALLAGDAQLVAVDLRFDLELGGLDGGDEFLGHGLFDALLDGDLLARAAQVLQRIGHIRQRTSMPRADSRPRRMSSICLSWKALDATWVTTKPSSSNLASVP